MLEKDIQLKLKDLNTTLVNVKPFWTEQDLLEYVDLNTTLVNVKLLNTTIERQS